MESNKRTIEVCFSPALFPYILTPQPYTVVVVDILRATTSICAAFMNEVKEIIPVACQNDAEEYKKKGYLVAAEKDGIKLPFADFGNSPDQFDINIVRGRSVAYNTTNGTKLFHLVGPENKVFVGSFINISALAKTLVATERNVVILCAGWKNKFNLEDSLFAGALAEKLLQYPEFGFDCDSAHAAFDLWQAARENPISYINKAMHRERLRKLKLDYVIDFCFSTDLTSIVPMYVDNRIIASSNP